MKVLHLLPLSVSVSVSVGIVNAISLRLMHSVSLAIILLHLLNHALLHWTLLWFPLKHRSVKVHYITGLCNFYQLKKTNT